MAGIHPYRPQQVTGKALASGFPRFVWRLSLAGAGLGLLFRVDSVLAADPFPYTFSTPNRFDNCTLDLIQRQISPQDAAQACAQALRPEDLRQCVVQITGSGQLAARDILNACRQVRRPVEMAGCVTDLRRDLKNASETEILNGCSLSLLPARFSQCARGLSRAPAIAATQALSDCNNGGIDQREFAPNFIPYTVLPSEQLQNQPAKSDLSTPTPKPPTAVPSQLSPKLAPLLQ